MSDQSTFAFSGRSYVKGSHPFNLYDVVITITRDPAKPVQLAFHGRLGTLPPPVLMQLSLADLRILGAAIESAERELGLTLQGRLLDEMAKGNQ